MNKMGIYFGYWTKDWIVDFSKYAKKAADLGFDIIEYDLGAIMDSPQEYQEKLKDTIEKLNIDITFCIGLSKKYDISSGDSRVRSKGIEFLKNAVKETHRLGGNQLSGIIYGAWGASLNPGEKDKSLYLERSAESFKEVVKVAEKLGVTCNVEVANRFEQFMLNTAEEAKEFIKMVGSDRLKIHLDTFHMNIEEDSFSKAIKLAGDDLGHFHIGENNRKLPGRGHLPWEEIMGALKEIKYEGAIVMEPFLLPGGDIAQDVKVWRNLDIKNKDEEAKKAKEYLINLLK
ncbi:D-tagatose 3-epimerase [Halanaerobium congolense]|jgi:D-psicose/D-tagatose/L-ribulose 3-epimerase|uniref:D-tagatose 3-epimerase n=1 Tax=Halanaerobium congolense TaxID=54121 RepID=A0A318DZE8_9FIRM|nr:sugar phosphate isomerase/epimerase family protein [Halanaerobium congolense]PXV59943.1 D-tagatose 3-epimerase [Halanaerobium congolense]